MSIPFTPSNDSNANVVVIMSPDVVSFHSKCFHESNPMMDSIYHNHYGLTHSHPTFYKTNETIDLNLNTHGRHYITRNESYRSATANGPDRVMDSLSLDDRSAAEGSQPRGSTSKHQSFSSGWDRASKRGKDRKIGHRRVDEAGQVTYKKIETSQICGSIQLGIGTAIASLASKPERDLLMQDFAMIETTNFVKEGSKTTPAHHYSDYKFKNYAPVAFRYFRDLFGIAPEDFLQSFCTEPLRELTNPGASGSVFYLTFDDEFIIKTVQHKEAEFLQKLLPGYYMVRFYIVM